MCYASESWLNVCNCVCVCACVSVCHCALIPLINSRKIYVVISLWKKLAPMRALHLCNIYFFFLIV